ncbi:MAG: HPr(Ser) kinase/phosphatase [Oscillospiraceae bacterium]|nr:HPr(Ser) kinase/phosphatase [Oscillospiraceae bacterium]
MATYSVTLQKLIKDLGLEPIYLPEDASNLFIRSADVNRPGLHLSGFVEYFEPSRIQITGKMEFAYLESLDPQTRKERIYSLLSKKLPALVVTRGLPIFPEMIDAAKENQVPLLRTGDSTSSFMSSLISILNVELAPRITRHGVLVEVYGEGMLLLGESGVGKSETAVELVKRGHRLIADDAVEIRKVSSRTLVGSSPENIRHFLEMRGVGIINARRLFGMGAVKITEKIDLIVQLEIWDPTKTYDRMGIENEYMNILGIDITSITIPVKPGRNLAIILEVAAMNNRQKKMGYNAGQELLQQLGMESEGANVDTGNWDFY